MAGQDLNLELIIKARADQAKAEIASTSASVKGLQSEAAAATEVSAARMNAALKSVGNDVSKVTPEMLGLGAATAAGAAPAEATAVAVGKLGKNIKEVGHVSPIALNEFRALFDEISSGRTYRSPGTIAIIAQKVLGLSTSALLAGGAVLGLAAAFGYLEVKAIETANAIDRIAVGAAFAGNLNLTSDEIKRVANEIGSDGLQIEGVLGRIGDTSNAVFEGLAISAAEYAQAMGVKAPQAVKTLVTALDSEHLSVAKLQEMFPGLTVAEAENYLAVQRMGDAHRTAAALIDLVQQRMQLARERLINYNAGWTSTGNDIRLVAAHIDEFLPDFNVLSGSIEGGIGFWDRYGKSIESVIGEVRKYTGLLNVLDPVQRVHNDLMREAAKSFDDKHWQALRDGATALAQGDNPAAKLAAGIKLAANSSAEKINELRTNIKLLQEDLTNPAATSGEKINFASKIADFQKQLASLTASHGEGSVQTAPDTKQSFAIFQASENAKAAAFKSGSAQRIAILAVEAAKAKALFGTESSEYQQALGHLTQARRQAAEEATRLAKQQIDQSKQNLDRQVQETNAAARQEVDGKRALLQQQVQLGQITSAQEIARETQLEDQLFKIARHGFEERLRLETLSPAQRKRITDQIEALEKQHQLKMTELANKSALNVQKQWEHALQPIGQAFDQSIKGMIQGTQSLHQALGGILDSIVAEFVNMGVKNLLHWVAIEAAKTAATSAGAIERVAVTKAAHGTSMAISAITAQKQIFNDALQAASAAFKATAAIPVIGPILAPVAAAGAFAAVEVFGGQIASAKGGYWELPSDQLIMAHEREMVLPARFAEGLRGLIENGGGAQNGPSHTSIHAVDAESLMRLLKRNPSAVAAGVRSAVRNGIIR